MLTADVADVADVVDAADVRVCDAKRHAHLAQEPIQAFLIVIEAGRQKLQSDRLAEFEVVGAVDLAHPTASQQSDHAVAVGKDRTGQETRAIAGYRGRTWRSVLEAGLGGCGGLVNGDAAVAAEPQFFADFPSAR